MLSTSIRKKRIACDNCHFSKVRCTGEASGCQRCERGARVCRYSESNMGRRKPSSDDAHNTLDAFVAVATAVQQQEKHQHQHGWDSSDVYDSTNQTGCMRDGQRQEHEQSSSTLADRRDSDLQIDESLGAWDEDHSEQMQRQKRQQQQQPFSALLLDTLSGNLPASPRFDPLVSSFDDMDFSGMDEGNFESAMSIAPSGHAHAQATTAQSPQMVPPEPRQKQAQIQATQMFGSPSPSTTPSYQASSVGLSQATTLSTASSSASGMRYWTTQLAELSQTPPRSPVPLDLMLQQSSQLLPRVTETLRSLHLTPDISSSASILILILVCLTQVVALIEQAIPSVMEGHLSACGAANLSLRLGAFQIDREDQQALQMHLVSKELSGMLQVSNLIRQTLLQPEWRCVSKRTHNLLLEDLQARTKTLVYQMKEKRGTARVLVF